MTDENQKTKLGTWASMDTGERRPNVEFDMNKPQVVTIEVDEPREIPWEDGAFYIFDCKHNGEEKCIKTSAFTLLRGLKQHEPLKGKTLTIVKEIVSGKQVYKVSEGNFIPEERVE